MPEFHYVRTLGEHGGVDACAGPAVGVDLETVLAGGLPPMRIALEMVAALCEVLDIADADSEVHGDLVARNVFLDEDGALSVEGFGIARGGKPSDGAIDRYRLGRIAHRLFSEHPLPWPLPEGEEPHDDAVLDAVLELDLSRLPEPMPGDVQWYVAKWLAHDPEERPSALDGWRTFVAFAATVEGPSLSEWAVDALAGGGMRRETGPPRVIEDLAEARRDAGPLAERLSLPAHDGGTAFWTRAKSTSDPEPGPITGFWAPEQLEAMSDDTEDAPRPRRAPGEGERRSKTDVFKRRLAERTGAEPWVTLPTEANAIPAGARLEPEVRGPVAPASAPRTTDVGLHEDRTVVLALIGMGSLGMVTALGLALLFVVGLAVVLWSPRFAPLPAGPATTPVEPVAAPAEPAPALRVGLTPGSGAPAAPPPPAAEPAPVPPAPASPRPAPVPVPEPEPVAEAPVVSAEDARVRISSTSRGTISRCADRRIQFDGFRAFEIEAYRLPVTCLVQIGDAVGTFMVYGSGEITCDLVDEAVACDKPRIQ